VQSGPERFLPRWSELCACDGVRSAAPRRGADVGLGHNRRISQWRQIQVARADRAAQERKARAARGRAARARQGGSTRWTQSASASSRKKVAARDKDNVAQARAAPGRAGQDQVAQGRAAKGPAVGRDPGQVARDPARGLGGRAARVAAVRDLAAWVPAAPARAAAVAARDPAANRAAVAGQVSASA